MKFSLPLGLYSPQQLVLVQDEIGRYASWYDHEKVRLSIGHMPAKLLNMPSLSAPAATVLAAWQGKRPVSDDTLAALLEQLDELAKVSPLIAITLAAMPSEGMKNNLVKWLRAEIHPDALVTFQFNGTLLGGMVIRVGSRIIDLSFRRQLLANRSQFTKVLRHV